MATFNITLDGVTYRVTAPAEIADSLTEADLRAMVSGGGGDQGFVRRFLGAVRHGIGETARGLGATARVVGNDLDSQSLRELGETLSGVLPADPNYEEATPQFVEGIRNMDRRALDYFPRAVIEQVPSLLLTRGAGRVAGVPGMVASGAGQSYGNIAEARAANDGRTPDQLTGTDRAAAGLGALGIGALEALGVRGAAGPAGQNMANFGLMGRARELGRSAAREGATEMPEQAVQQAAASLGTERGLQLDPAEIIAAGPLGAGARGLTGAPGAALRGSVESVARFGAERVMGDMSPEVAESVVRLSQLLEENARLFRERTGTDAAPTDLFNAARGALEADLRNFVTLAERAGWLDREAGEGRVMRDLIKAAVTHNRAVVDGVPTEPFSLGEGLGRIDALQRAPAEFRQGMRALLTDLDQLSRAARKNRMTGAFERVGDLLGRGAGVATGAALGGPYGLAASVGAAVAGNPIGARFGAALGRSLDRALGTRLPTVVLARSKAERIVRDAGAEAGNTTRIRDELNRLLNDERLAERARLGLPTDPDTVAREAAKAAEKAAKRGEQERGLKAEAAAAEQQEAADRERARRDYETRFRAQGASPEEIQRILDAQRRAESVRKAADFGREAREMDNPAPDTPDAVTRAQRAEHEAFRAHQERQARAAQARQEAEARKREADAARQAAEQQRAALAEIAAQAAASGRAADAADAARRDAEQRRLLALERDAERAAKAAEKAQKAAEAEAAKAAEAEAAKAAEAEAAKAAEAEAVEAAKRRAQKAARTAPAPEAPPVTAAPAAPTSRARQEDAHERPSPVDGRGPLRGWMRYVRVVFANKGVPDVSKQEMLDALDRAVERGAIEEDVAAVYRSAQDRMARVYLDEVLGEIAEARGVDLTAPDIEAGVREADENPEAGARGFYRPDIYDPASWQGVAAARQDHVRFYREQAVARGDFQTAELLARFGTETDRQLTPDERRVLARALINSAREDQAGFRRAAVAPWLKGEPLDAE